MVLLHLLNNLKVNLTVIHVNYQLRGEESIRDAELVQTVCFELGVPCEIRTVDLKKTLENGGNLQDEARKVRYSWFDEILEEDSANCIALAHHQDDQVETFLMNLARKSGIVGLACMKQEHDGIVRPLLDFSKAEILKYAQNNNLQWREDQSNQSNNYTRNRLRNEFIPFVKSEIVDFDSSVLLLIDAFQQTQLELEQTVHPIVASIIESAALPFSSFNDLNEFEQVELFRQLKIPASYVPRLNSLTKRGKRLEFNDALFESVVRDEDQFTFLEKEHQSVQLLVQEVDSLPISFDKHQAYFDASKINGKLQLRTWEVGDRISPIGMNGSQLVSDIIKDSKITADAKRDQLVVYDTDSILWCVGLKISRNAIADANTKKILRCSIIDSAAEESEVQ